MILNVKLRLTSPMLAGLPPGRDGIRHFDKQGNCILVNQAAWLEQFSQAAGRLGYVIDIDTIVPPDRILTASVHIYRKEFSRVKVELFESFRKGTILSLQIEVKDAPKAPSEHQMGHLLAYVGVHLGISPWGSRCGFGRFDVLEISK